jgi:hypothetical protein
MKQTRMQKVEVQANKQTSKQANKQAKQNKDDVSILTEEQSRAHASEQFWKTGVRPVT